MSIVNLRKPKVLDLAEKDSSNDNKVTKRFEVLTSKSIKTTPTIISKDLTIEGEIKGSGLIEIEGKIKGTIKGNSVILREASQVEGTIIAKSLTVKGQFEGTINADSIIISSRARINGNIEYGSLSVEDGASIDGQFKKITN